MIRGIGIDLADIERLREVDDMPGLLEQILTPREINRVTRSGLDLRTVALFFSAKEALVKALGCGLIHGWHWHDIEISDDFHIDISGHLQEVAVEQSVSKIQISCSLLKNHSITLVVLDG